MSDTIRRLVASTRATLWMKGLGGAGGSRPTPCRTQAASCPQGGLDAPPGLRRQRPHATEARRRRRDRLQFTKGYQQALSHLVWQQGEWQLALHQARGPVCHSTQVAQKARAEEPDAPVCHSTQVSQAARAEEQVAPVCHSTQLPSVDRAEELRAPVCHSTQVPQDARAEEQAAPVCHSTQVPRVDRAEEQAALACHSTQVSRVDRADEQGAPVCHSTQVSQTARAEELNDPVCHSTQVPSVDRAEEQGAPVCHSTQVTNVDRTDDQGAPVCHSTQVKIATPAAEHEVAPECHSTQVPQAARAEEQSAAAVCHSTQVLNVARAADQGDPVCHSTQVPRRNPQDGKIKMSAFLEIVSNMQRCHSDLTLYRIVFRKRKRAMQSLRDAAPADFPQAAHRAVPSEVILECIQHAGGTASVGDLVSMLRQRGWPVTSAITFFLLRQCAKIGIVLFDGERACIAACGPAVRGAPSPPAGAPGALGRLHEPRVGPHGTRPTDRPPPFDQTRRPDSSP